MSLTDEDFYKVLNWLHSEGDKLPQIRSVVQSILDEPIPKVIKNWLLKPLLPRHASLTRKHTVEKWSLFGRV